MAWPFPHQPASRADALERRLRAQARRLDLLIPCRSASDPRLLDHLRKTFVQPMDRAGSDAPGRGPLDGSEGGARTGITERNSIWVLTVSGIWRGDYHKRAHAQAAAGKAREERP